MREDRAIDFLAARLLRSLSSGLLFAVATLEHEGALLPHSLIRVQAVVGARAAMEALS